MNSKHRQVLKAIFSNPIPSNIRWKDVEALFINLGALVEEGNGSRVRIKLNGIRATFHKPHPNPEIHKETIKDIRTFLNNAGINYDDL